MTAWRFIEPFDVLYFRGNKLFGDPGSSGVSSMPPLPSVAAGALRSMILVSEGVNLEEFTLGNTSHPVVGSVDEAGPFTLRYFSMAQRYADGIVQPLFELPADLVASTDRTQSEYESIRNNDDGGLREVLLERIEPSIRFATDSGLLTSAPLASIPILRQREPRKSVPGVWLTSKGMQQALEGLIPDATEIVFSHSIWKSELRTGIGLDGATRAADDGKLFTTQAISLEQQEDRTTGFCIGVDGSADQLPREALLRLGGDARGALMSASAVNWPAVPLQTLVDSGSCRILLHSPAIFDNGWLLPGMNEDGRIQFPGLKARVRCAAFARPLVVSGFDVARRQPKLAQRAVPSGSVYWLDEMDTSIEALEEWLKLGLWLPDDVDAVRRAEGFNRFQFGVYLKRS